MKYFITSIAAVMFYLLTVAQNAGLGTASPATSLLVYNTNAGLNGGVGFYYNSGTPGAPAWIRLQTIAASGNFWSIMGNAGPGLVALSYLWGCVPDLIVSGDAAGYTFHEASNSVSSTNVLTGGLSSALYLNAGNYVDLKIGFEALAASGYFDASISPCNFPAFAPDSLLNNYFDFSKGTGLIVKPLMKTSILFAGLQSKPNANPVFVVDIQQDSDVKIFLENEKYKILSYLHTGFLSQGKYAISILKPRPTAGSLFIVTEARGGKRRFKLLSNGL